MESGSASGIERGDASSIDGTHLPGTEAGVSGCGGEAHAPKSLWPPPYSNRCPSAGAPARLPSLPWVGRGPEGPAWMGAGWEEGEEMRLCKVVWNEVPEDRPVNRV